jgi:hypothetical protein
MDKFLIALAGTFAFLVINSYVGVVAPTNAGGVLGIGK